MDDPKPRAKFVARKREKKTRFSVRFADFVSTHLITVGGIGTIVAVSLVAVLLVAVVVPLFSSASLEVPHLVPAPWPATQAPLYVKVDEYQTTGWTLHEDGTLQVFRLDTGERISSQQILSDSARITSISVIPDIENARSNDATRMHLAIGLDDGSVQLGTIGLQTSFREESDVRAGIRTLGIGEIAVVGEGVVQVTPRRQFRIQEVTSQFAPPIKLAETAITRLAHAPRLKNIAVAAYADEKLVFGLAKQRRSLDGETAYRLKPRRTLDYSWRERGSPDYMLVPSRGDGIYVVWKDGHLARFDTRIIKEAQLAEELELLDDEESRITTIGFALNRETLLCGDSRGRIRGWFPVDRRNAARLKGAIESTDGKLLAPIHQLPSGSAAVTSMGASERTRMIAAGYADGSLRVFHVTTDQLIVDATTGRQQPIRYVAIAPKDDGLFAAVDRELWRSEFDPGHPETTLTSLFLPIWYEGYHEPDMLWQSSFAGVGPEMKLGLWPLVFGTLKATFYCMLFGAPLALLAAVFTSEFMPPGMKGTIKPMVEMMASLPSVVLGFLAALVFAPVVEGFVPMTLCAFATLPLVFLLGAFLWLLLPQPIGLRYERYRFWLIGLVLVPLGLFFAGWLGPFVENWLFAGDIKLWLDGQIGTGTGAWMLVMLPMAGVVMTTVVSLAINPWMRRRCGQLSRRQFALLNLGKFLSALLLAFVMAWSCSELLTALGFDPRGSYVDTYVQRNALVVGFVMGFAVIPIIYTIAEDALSTVPQHLRSASLGAGATQWQTAVRIVIPTAMSGLFSAVMIGLGRAVGETMIVLMAGGNTPVRDWNIFNGFRTLAANIAVELPEAVQNSTHYRTLFLAALTLFAMTFFVNTIAEFIRLRFRRRAIEL